MNNWVWIFRVNNSENNGGVVIFIFDTEERALLAACEEIQNQITNEWDSSFSNWSFDQKDFGKKVNTYIATAEYSRAISAWNDYQPYIDFEKRITITVYCKDICTDSAVPDIRSDSFFNDNSGGNEESIAFVAEECGATCRKCEYMDEYAYADNGDGTFLCNQCRKYLDESM